MALFTNLEERFKQRTQELYNKLSAKDAPSEEPFLSWTPNDPNRNETRGDSRILPIGSTKRDLIRLARFSKSSQGLLFYGKQALLQLANTFSETRFYNPLFVEGNAVPYLHLRRTLGPTADELTSDPSYSAGSSGQAGRLQLESKSKAISRVVQTKSTSAQLLQSALTVSGISAIVGAAQRYQQGISPVNTRPELDIQGNIYSVQLWKGVINNSSTITDRITSAIVGRGGNVASLTGAASTVINVINGNSAPADVAAAGHLQNYFITDGYEGIQSYIKLKPRGAISPTSFIQRLPVNTGTANLNLANNLDSLRQNGAALVQNTARLSTSVSPNLASSIKSSSSKTATIAEVQFEKPERSLKYIYENDVRAKEIKLAIETQRNVLNQLQGVSSLLRGIEGGLSPAKLQNADYATAIAAIPVRNSKFTGRKTTAEGLPGYYLDRVNLIPIFHQQDESALTVPTDYIKFRIKDYVNNNVIILRAIISGLSESTNPSYDEQRYLGRQERFISYSGATRDVNFAVILHAFSPEELTTIWDKVNYLTGLSFPSGQSNGFMTPPLIQFTIGDMYKNQPGFIRGMQSSIDDNTSWETVEGNQVPMTVQLQFSIGILEKKTMFSNRSAFYDYANDAESVADNTAIAAHPKPTDPSLAFDPATAAPIDPSILTPISPLG